MKRLSTRWTATAFGLLCALLIFAMAVRRQPVSQDLHRAKCAARLGKVGRALQLYARTHDGRFPVVDTAADADKELLPLLRSYGVTATDLRCPARPNEAYVYHCYRKLGSGGWPRWISLNHVVTLKSPPGTWLVADPVARDLPGPHSNTQKAFNYLTTDGRVHFQTGHPRAVYK